MVSDLTTSYWKQRNTYRHIVILCISFWTTFSTAAVTAAATTAARTATREQAAYKSECLKKNNININRTINIWEEWVFTCNGISVMKQRTKDFVEISLCNIAVPVFHDETSAFISGLLYSNKLQLLRKVSLLTYINRVNLTKPTHTDKTLYKVKQCFLWHFGKIYYILLHWWVKTKIKHWKIHVCSDFRLTLWKTVAEKSTSGFTVESCGIAVYPQYHYTFPAQ